jgi:response regulator of citrate/malate metabolism
MANQEKNMRQIKEIFRRKDQGESSRSIARQTGFSRNTIDDYVLLPKISSICSEILWSDTPGLPIYM